MRYTISSVDGPDLEIDLSITEKITFEVNSEPVTLDPNDVGLLYGLLTVWIARGGQSG